MDFAQQLHTYCNLSDIREQFLLGHKGLKKVQKLTESNDCIVIYKDLGREVYDSEIPGQELRRNVIAASDELARWSVEQGFHKVYFFNFDAGDEYDRNERNWPFVYEKRIDRLYRKYMTIIPGEKVAWETPPTGSQNWIIVNAVNNVQIDESQAQSEIEIALEQCGVASVQRVEKHATFSKRVRHFTLLEKESLITAFKSKMRIVYLHIPVWDYFVPTKAQLDEFVAIFKQREQNSLIVMHCASGSGRSGAFAYMARLCELVEQTPGIFRGRLVEDVEDTLFRSVLPLYNDGKAELTSTKQRVRAFCCNAAAALNKRLNAGIHTQQDSYI